MTRTIIEFHALQTVPPSCINRDDTGSPKTAVYGGATRARVSSQAWKRAIRTVFADQHPTNHGLRTKSFVEPLADRITPNTTGTRAAALDLAARALIGAGIPLTVVPDGGIPQTSALAFLAPYQLDALADVVRPVLDDTFIDAWATRTDPEASKDAVKVATKTIESLAKDIDTKALKAALRSGNSFDIALFGRMMAASKDLNVDAACQVAHALSVHASATEFDYFTALDDIKDGDVDQQDSGAAMIGTKEFTSATLYRYATVDFDALIANLGSLDAAVSAATLFATAFTTSMPTGSQNTFANATLPEALVVTLRDSQPINLVGAFERPIVRGDGYRERAAIALAKETQQVEDAYGLTPVARFVLATSTPIKDALAALGEPITLPAMTGALGQVLAGRYDS